jgi:hypothetical protein
MCSVEDLLSIASMNTTLIVKTLDIIGSTGCNQDLSTATVIEVFFEEDWILTVDRVAFLCILA